MNTANITVKIRNNYTCSVCGSTEKVQAHHQVPRDASTLIPLCAECHSRQHPDIPKALFLIARNQPYWNNRSASSVAKNLGVHSRTVIRASKVLKIPQGTLSKYDEQLLEVHIAHNKHAYQGIPDPLSEDVEREMIDQENRMTQIQEEIHSLQAQILSLQTEMTTIRHKKLPQLLGKTNKASSSSENLCCPRCGSEKIHKDGFIHHKQRYKCRVCSSTTLLPKRTKEPQKVDF